VPNRLRYLQTDQRLLTRNFLGFGSFLAGLSFWVPQLVAMLVYVLGLWAYFWTGNRAEIQRLTRSEGQSPS
jgi:protein-S-isoprenylcysteine O-methyltransferase Ste14